ncbi:MAG: hypothetical protein AB7P03_30050 [Kofleriaceae bacterium]
MIVRATLGIASVGALAIASCSIDHRSGELQCTSQSDCTSDRVCRDGYCVGGGGNPRDAVADSSAPDALLCPPQCSSCNLAAKSCTIDCAVTSCTGNAAIVCPVGWACNVTCSVQSSCRNGVVCAGATACKVQCSGVASCRNVQCGMGPCEVSCTGPQSCRGVACGTSCACDVDCEITADCEDVSCTNIACTSIGGCRSSQFGCNTCDSVAP